jgi:hypothetical protein
MRPNSITSLADYCMQQLGSPVIDIHVAEEQVQNRIEDALDFFQEFHDDATERTYLTHKVRGNEIATVSATSFVITETVTGAVSGATAVVNSIVAGILIVSTPVGTFIQGESITGSKSGANGTLTSYTTGDIDNGYLPVGAGVVAISDVYPIVGTGSTSQFSYSYQLKLQDLYSLQYNGGNGIGGSGGLAQYEETKEYLNTLDSVLTGVKLYQFNRRKSQLVIDMDWKNTVQPGSYIVIEAFVIIDPALYTSMFDDRMLKKLATAYIKKQWGSNMKLHSGIMLPGGITINGQQIYDEAMQEVENIENQIRDTYQDPCGFLVG